MILIESLPKSQEETNLTKDINLRTVTVWASDKFFSLEPNYQKSLIPTVLVIDRENAQIREIKAQEFQTSPKNAVPYYFSFLIGIINLNGKRLLFLAEEAELVCTIKKRDIFKITKPIFLFYRPQDKNDLSSEEAKLLMNFVFIFEQGMYFSFSYNLTEPVYSIRKRERGDVDSVFNWGQNLQTQLRKFDKTWSLPVIQGFVNKVEVHISAQKLKLILISRRSLKQGGPLQYTVGVDCQGNTANYIETELLISMNDLLFSFMQVRGSIPLFWVQKYSYGILSSVSIQKSIQENSRAMQLHLSKVLKQRSYKHLYLLNLLSSSSASEAKLIQNYEYLVRKTEKWDNVSYCYFDMHALCENKKYKAFNSFIQTNALMRGALKKCGFTALEFQEDGTYKTLYRQDGVIRTNCSSCIDRTNIAQSRIAAAQILYILHRIDVKIENFDENMEFIENDSPFSLLYRNLWADNGDSLSRQYTGTESTESFAYRQGKLSYMTSFDHGLTSLVRALRTIRDEDFEKRKAVQFIMSPNNQQYKQKLDMFVV